MSDAYGVLVATNIYTNSTYTLPPFSLQSIAVPAAPEVKRLVNNREVVVGESSWDTQRLTINATWTLRFPFMDDAVAPAMTTSRLKSLLLGWLSSGAVLTIAGPDFLNIDHEELVDIGASVGQVWRSAQPWWGTGEAIAVDGTVVSDSLYTVNASLGTVTFDTPLGSGHVVECTVSREPRVRVMSVAPDPQNFYDPVVYGPEVVLHEETPLS